MSHRELYRKKQRTNESRLYALPRTHPESIWDATPEPVLRALLLASRQRGPVLDPFCGAGTVGRVALGLGREWIGVERDPRMAHLTARRLKLVRAR